MYVGIPNESLEKKSKGTSDFVFKIINNSKLFIVLFLIVLFFSINNKNYFTVRSFYVILMGMSILGIVSVGQTMCILVRGFDLIF